MTTTTPIWDTIQGNLRNALTIAAYSIDDAPGGDLREAFADIQRRLRAALEQLGEPNESMIRAVQHLTESYSPLMAAHESPEDMARYWRDSAAIILRAAVNGYFPEGQ